MADTKGSEAFKHVSCAAGGEGLLSVTVMSTVTVYVKIICSFSEYIV